MIRRRRRKRGFPAEALVRNDRLEVARFQESADAILELDRPVVGFLRMLSPGVGVEVVDDVARPEDEDVLVAQRRESARELVMLVRRERLVDPQLDDGDVRLRIEVHEERPGAVVESPAGIQLYRRGGE